MTRLTPDRPRPGTSRTPLRTGPRTSSGTRARTAGRSRVRIGTTLGALLALAVVSTAGAPSLITVRPGDTLWDLARTHGTSVSSLRALNELPGNGTIYAGQRLQVAGGASGQSSSGDGGGGERSHRVSSGETLSHLAVRYGVSAAVIASRNGLTGDRVYAGSSLVIPGGGATSSSTSSSAGASVPGPVRTSVADNRAVLAGRSHPAKAQVRAMVADTARAYGVSPSLAVAVAYHESGFQQRVVSGVNAIGVMQVLPSTGRVLSQQSGQSLDLLDTQDNITAGVLLLRQLIRSQGSADAALAGYYQGLGSISRQGLLPQTHDYIESIRILRNRYPNG